ncbi:MAG: aspartyl protease family protein [Sphingomonas sp.]|nr:aspartyl protease family protein [Sphingomonas sp.]
MSAIEWRREPRRILLPVIVLAPYPVADLTGWEATALIDTGSSVSGVATRIAEDMGLKQLGKRPLKSAQGLGQVERYAFRIGFKPDQASSSSPAFPFVFDEVIGIELTDTFEFNALIGMDILRQCDFSMSRDGHCCLRFG